MTMWTIRAADLAILEELRDLALRYEEPICHVAAFEDPVAYVPVDCLACASECPCGLWYGEESGERTH